MDQDYLDSEIIADFLVEAREHLESIEPNLLILENSPKDLQVLNEVFRSMHSLKGASGFLNLQKMNGLAHKAENALDELRQDKLSFTAELADVILSATDALRLMLDNLENEGGEGDVPTDAIAARIDAIVAGKTAEVAQAPKAAEPVAKETTPVADISNTQTNQGLVATSCKTTELHEIENFCESLSVILYQLQEEYADDPFLKVLANFVEQSDKGTDAITIDILLDVAYFGESFICKILSNEYALNMPSIIAVKDFLTGVLERINQLTQSDSDIITMFTKNIQMESSGMVEANCLGEDEDLNVFRDSMAENFSKIENCFNSLNFGVESEIIAKSIVPCLKTIENSTDYMGFKDICVTTKRIIELIEQGIEKSIDFDMMINLLQQECSIVEEDIEKELSKLGTANPSSVVSSAKDETGKRIDLTLAAQIKVLEEQIEKALQETSALNSDDPLFSKNNTATEVNQPEVNQPEVSPAAVVETEDESKKVPASVEDVISQIAENAPQAVENTNKNKAPVKAAATIRVEHQKLDHLMNLIGELIISRGRYAMLARALESGTQDVQYVAQQLTETTYALSRISDELQDTIMNVRMLPVQSVFSRFPRLVRDLSRKCDKTVELVVHGEDTELDKSVVEEIGDPLVHLVRNSMDHGLETDDERVAAGKTVPGHVFLRAYYKGNAVVIEVEDDGRGINPEKMRQIGVKKGLITEDEAKSLDDKEALELIFAPGFSSAEVITDVSGRGVGMDVVRSNIKKLKGTVHVNSTMGKGSKFTLILPLTLAIIDALMVEIDDRVYAIPLDAVSETTKIDSSQLRSINGKKVTTIRGEVLSLVELGEVLDMSVKKDTELFSVVVIQNNEKRVGLIVDKLLERQEIVIKPLGQFLSRFNLPGISGATIMGDGSVVLILDPYEIYLLATKQSSMNI